MFEFFEELEGFFNSFIEMILSTAAANSEIWEQLAHSEIYVMLMRYRDSFPQPISWAIFIVIFTTLLEFTRRGRRL